jgi:transketolase
VSAPGSNLQRLDAADLEALAFRVREHVIRMSAGGGCFIGASLSCVDLLVHLYGRVLRMGPDRCADPERDYLLLSKGHDVPALYGTLAELGYFPRERLGRHLHIDDCLYWHPNRGVPGVEFHSGSLGHLLSVGMGIALDARLSGSPSRVFVVLGDGELDEGSVWEALLVAHAKRLGNLVVIVDRNEFQANIRTEDLIPLEPLAPKFEAFGWRVRTVDGHSFRQLEAGLQDVGAGSVPTAVIARTVRGKGVPSIEARADRWFLNLTQAEVEGLLHELRGGGRAGLVSEAPMVR